MSVSPSKTIRDLNAGVCFCSHLGRCEGRIDLHHIVKAQRVRQFVATQTGDRALAELAVSDSRNHRFVCRRHHDQIHDASDFKGPVPASVQEFIEDWGLSWSLEYDEAKAVA